MLLAPHLLRRSSRLWVLGLLGWLALALQGAVALPAVHPAIHGGMDAMAAAVVPHSAEMGVHPDTSDCCAAAGAAAHCACPATCTAVMPILPEGWILAALPPPVGPAGSPAGTAPHRFGSPPLRPPMV